MAKIGTKTKDGRNTLVATVGTARLWRTPKGWCVEMRVYCYDRDLSKRKGYAFWLRRIARDLLSVWPLLEQRGELWPLTEDTPDA